MFTGRISVGCQGHFFFSEVNKCRKKCVFHGENDSSVRQHDITNYGNINTSNEAQTPTESHIMWELKIESFKDCYVTIQQILTPLSQSML